MTEHRPTPDAETEADEEKWPIGFLIVVTLAGLYLGWRLAQSVGWLIDKF